MISRITIVAEATHDTCNWCNTELSVGVLIPRETYKLEEDVALFMPDARLLRGTSHKTNYPGCDTCSTTEARSVELGGDSHVFPCLNVRFNSVLTVQEGVLRDVVKIKAHQHGHP